MNRTSTYALATLAAIGMATGAHAMSETPRASTSSAATATVSEAEATHRMATLQTGTLALETSRLALQKARDPLVKQFAQAEVAEQTTIAEVFKSMYPDMPAPALNEENAAKLNELKNASASRFDRMYVQGQIDGHKKLLETQEDYISSGNMREEVNVAKLARGQIREHIMLLTAYQQRMK